MPSLAAVEYFECPVCGVTFTVQNYERFTTVYCPVCRSKVWTQKKEITYRCDDCGNEFTSELQPHFCPSCGGEELSVR